ncbi:LPS O-antigen chain length determinant protein WzzB [Thiomicrorhabdus chilensis]|uniref:LPS O-antigen chain length determinant protein WzzB n=1 Tax=Thiomicrorhabdus chilensis TaxID=63656 RepID=UPI000426330E|nr:Wzz/FepE/Etk N-terminal domain-containing protein [Thiomicrorhabdus chilensis]
MQSGQSFENDEIDLFELWNGLVQEKWTIVLSFVAAVILAGLYAFTATPVYKSTAYFLPPTVEDVQEMNALNLLTDKSFYQPPEVYENFIEHLKSRDVSQAIFNRFNLVELYVQELEQVDESQKVAVLNRAFDQFSKSIGVNLPKKNASGNQVSVDLSLERSPQETADILNALIALAQEKTAHQFFKDIQSEMSIRQQRLHDQVASLRKIEKERRLDRVVQLQEAANIARSLDLKEPMMSAPQVNIVNMEGGKSQGMPLYYLGYQLLEAELSALKSRENDDPFIGELRGLQQKLSELQELKLDIKKFGVVTVDQFALPAAKPIKPKKALILAVGGVLGLMLGVFVALIRRAVKNRKMEQKALPTV